MESYLPLLYFAVAIAVIALLLPSVLRPPAQQSNQSAQLSPNSPHSQQQSIIAAFQSAESGTNGAGQGAGAGAAPGGLPGAPAPAAEAVSGPPHYCPFGVGQPPLQLNSPYAPPCAAGYNGKNPGATYQGVTVTTVRIAVGDIAGATFPQNGPVPTQPSAGEGAADRFYTDMQLYFNQAFQLWGRSLQLIGVTQGTGASGDVKAETAAAKDYSVFAATTYTPPFCPNAVQDHMPVFCRGQYELPYYQQRQPYLYSWFMDETQSDQFIAENICKNLAGKAAKWAGPGLSGRPRKFGLIYSEDPTYPVDGPDIARDLKEQCNLSLAVDIGYDLTAGDSNGNSALASALVRFEDAGVTTVLDEMDYLSSAEFTNQAASAGYVPEWYDNGASLMDRNQLAADQNQAEWAHAFGFTTEEMEIPLSDTACYQVVQAVDPGYSPNESLCNYQFPSLLQLVSGIQGAGPDLTPTTLDQGLVKNGYKYYSNPSWPAGGGFSADNPTYIKNVAEMWWKPGAVDPVTGDPTGAYEYLDGGARYRLGQLPGGDRPYFTSGTTVPDGGYGGSF
ncbi:MAG TPA: hypothetical protein VE990_07620 [Acidimicrobiales bacterium]|nr:hypothetical protein [Acidimicrobiales bacterium]